jgi:hypothetical protein
MWSKERRKKLCQAAIFETASILRNREYSRPSLDLFRDEGKIKFIDKADEVGCVRSAQPHKGVEAQDTFEDVGCSVKG